MPKPKEKEVEVVDTTRQELDLLYCLLRNDNLSRDYFFPAHANLHALEDKIRSFLEAEVKERLK